VQDKHPELSITLHLHDTRGMGIANAYAGLEMGVSSFDACVGGLGGCPFAPGATGNICTEDLVYLLHECGYETGISLERLCAVALQVEALLGRPLPGQLMRAGPRLRIRALDEVRRAVG